MAARFETIRFGPWALVDVGGDRRLAERVHAWEERWENAMIIQRGRGERLKTCRADSKPEPQNAINVFALRRDGKFYGSWSLIGFQTRSLKPGLWDVNVQMAPCLLHVKDPNYVKKVAEIGSYLLSVPLEMIGGGKTRIRKWTFPDQRAGEDPTHQWGLIEVSGFRELIEARGLVFKTHFRPHPKYGPTEYMESIERRVAPVGFADGR